VEEPQRTTFTKTHRRERPATGLRLVCASATLATLAALVAATPARADDVYADPGAYLMLAGVNSFDHFVGAERDFDNSWGFAIRGGYRMNRFVAFEGSFEFLAGYEVDVALPNDEALSLTVDGGTATGNVKVYAPWLGRIQPYGLVGIGGQWARLRTTNPTGFVCDPFFWYCSGTYTELDNAGAFTSKFGAGVEFWLSEDLGLVVDAAYTLPTGDLKDLRSTSLTWGAIFRF